MLFSVIIPTYNRRALLEQALASVWAQTFLDYEVIVVDDGSTDGTWEFLQTLGPRVVALRQPNKGPAAARNLGARHAKAQYLAFLDSDDLWFPWTLETFDQLTGAHDYPALLTGKLSYFSGSRPPDLAVAGPPAASDYEDYFASSAARLSVGAGTMAVKNSVFAGAGGFDERLTALEDHDLSLRLGCERGFVAVSQPSTLACRRHSTNVSGDPGACYAGALHLLATEAAGGYPGGRDRADARRTIIARHVRNLSLELSRKGCASEALHLYRQTAAWHLHQGRWRYLIAGPAIMGARVLAGSMRVGGR